MNKDIDIIIYGATGFTGKLCVKYFQSLKTSVTWAIAGRNITKLQKVAKHNQTEVEILIADSDDESALDQLTSRSKGDLVYHRAFSQIWIKIGGILHQESHSLCRYYR